MRTLTVAPLAIALGVVPITTSLAGCSNAVSGSCPAMDATTTATIQISTDDDTVLYVNGALIDDAPHPWQQPRSYNVPVYRNPSRPNVIAIRGTNELSVDGRDRGILFDLTVSTSEGTQHLVSDASWRVGQETAGWNQVAFDDSNWAAAAVEGVHGIAPWGPLFGESTASWIWSYDSNLAVTQKPGMESIAARATFYLDAAGHVARTPAPCP